MRSKRSFGLQLLCSAGVAALMALGGAAQAQPKQFDIPAQPLGEALARFGSQSDYTIVTTSELTGRKVSAPVTGAAEPEVALAQLLTGTGLSYRREGDMFLIVKADQGPQSGSATGEGAEVEALIVTAQKREEDIQDVPIAISAFSQKDLEAQKIEGGFDLVKAIPNVTFSKNNFTGYNFSIRGVGTKAISATTDPGVAVSFNNIALIQNRLFEQEYFDIERVEVLRGPQGTLYGRNATAGVINVISAKPDMNDFEGSLKGEIGNYGAKRLVGMANFPIVEDVLAVRFAGSMTQRDGYDYNSITQNKINGRDLWSARVTVGFNPTDSIRSNLIWEHFEEDDNRSRTGKQLCHRDPGPEVVGNTAVREGDAFFDPYRVSLFSQGCKPGSLYDRGAFDTPNGLALPFPIALMAMSDLRPAFTENGNDVPTIQTGDPFGGLQQSRDLRTIASIRDPIYRAKADVFALSVDWDLTDSLTLSSQTLYNEDEVYSFQDYNRFNTVPFFTDTSEWGAFGVNEFDYSLLAPGGVFCDPQIGCSDSIAGFDISSASSRQLTQELRLQSDFDGPVNFSVGANYTRFNVLADYYVMNNLITMLAIIPLFNRSPPGSVIDPRNRIFPCNNIIPAFDNIPIDDPAAGCPYVDPNPLESMDGEGHNYFRSKNPYKLKSAAMFGELYWNVLEDLKVTAGLRYTDDRKTFVPVPTQVLLSKGIVGGGVVNKGAPEDPPIKQHWKEWTGRIGVDWKPELSFTNDTLLYAFYSRGYKGGGANPPRSGFATEEQACQDLINQGIGFFCGSLPILELTQRNYGDTFLPEFVDAFEVGAKNTLLQGALTFNTGAFFYDYKDYQVSQIRDRTAVNENFDAQVWGLEFETAFAPSRNFRLLANLGYLDTKIGDGMRSIDIMNRTQGDPNYVLMKPWLQYPSNCVVPLPVAESWLQTNSAGNQYWRLCGEIGGLLGPAGFDPIIDPTLNKPYDRADYPEINDGAGLWDDLSGNELPNSPHWTTNIGAEYSREILDGSWRVTLRGDAYWQSQSWARVYNLDPYDKLHGWYNANVSVRLSNEDLGLDAEFYVKNLLDKSPITDAFLNSDDSALTTNVFVLDPRLVGFNLRKTFGGR